MRCVGMVWLFTSLAWAQAPSDPATLSGVLLERDADTGRGEFSVRAADFHVHRFRYDTKTAVNREEQEAGVAALRPGDHVDVTSDQVGDDALRYARAIQVTFAVPAPVVKRAPPTHRIRPYSAAEERLLPKGDLSFAGVIVRLDGSRLVLRMRTGSEQTILLRQDTRYLDNGELVAAAALKPTMSVFVRGSKNLYGDVEGYQVSWGNILEVK